MSAIATVILSAAIFIFLLRWFRSKLVKQTNFIKKIPAPASSLPLLGVALDFASSKAVLKVLLQYTNTYGSIVKAKIGPIRQLILVSDYKLLEHVLSSTKVLVKSDDYNFLRPWLGNGLLTSDGRKWKERRRILTPAFHFQILEQFIEVFESCGDTFIKKLEQNIGKISFDIYPYVTLCSLDIICESIMGISINAQNNDKSDYVKSVKNMCRIAIDRTISPIEMHDSLYPFTRNYYTQKKAIAVLHKQSNGVISSRKKELEKNPCNNNKIDPELYIKNKKAFLDLLLHATVDGRSLTHEEIREEVDTFMFEGHDTTSSAISFTLYCLANHLEVQKKVLEEQHQIFGNKENSLVTYADLQNMKYLECAIKESLRLYPSVPLYGRKLDEDLAYGDEVIPKGVTLLLFAFGIHRNPDYYTNPDEFRPERFENSDGKLPYAYIPFSAGPRNCIGQKFAMLEMKSVISKVLRNFELRPATPEHKLDLIAEAILKSANGINISLKRRLVTE
ncbi:cytochrome P450 4c3-like isoform X2 [Zophobas morio]|uniref:cytochrome P450 4c3-like isoform X2 n=1 Tax=Zophobas morio TaxID=2755281 RepID=UPI003082BA26